MIPEIRLLLFIASAVCIIMGLTFENKKRPMIAFLFAMGAVVTMITGAYAQ